MAFGAENSVNYIVKLTQITTLSMVNNYIKLALNCKAVGSDKISNLIRSSDKLGHVYSDLVEGLSSNNGQTVCTMIVITSPVGIPSITG